MNDADVHIDRKDGGPVRRIQVMDAALRTFARYGYRKTSMDDIARAAGISRPGLYFHFPSKQDLFRAAATRALDLDLIAAQRALADRERPLRERLVTAFDHWTGRYIGPMTQDIPVVIDSNPDLLGPKVTDYPRRFAALISDALITSSPDGQQPVAREVARTLVSAATGIKHETNTREEFLDRLTRSVDLLLLALQPDL